MKMIHKRLVVRARRGIATFGFLAALFAPVVTFGGGHQDELTDSGERAPAHSMWKLPR